MKRAHTVSPTSRTANNCLPCLVLLALLLCGTAPRTAAALDASLVRVRVTFQENDPLIPWQKQPPKDRNGYGIAVASNRVLTAEHLVRNQTQVEIQLPRSGAQIPARVLRADLQIDLALLETAPGAPLLEPVAIQDTMDLRTLADFTIAQMDHTDAIQTGTATLRFSAMAGLAHAPFEAILTQFTADISPNRTGIPLLAGNRLAGLTLRRSHSARTIDVLPGAVLARFVRDASEGAYTGFAMAGFIWQPLIDPAERAFHNVHTPGGIRIASVLPGTGASETLQPNDILLNWNSIPIDAMGFCQDPDMGRVGLGYLTRFLTLPGERVPVRLVRDGTIRTELVRVSRFEDQAMLIPENVTGAPEPYLVEGGLILRELSGYFLKERGNNWMQRVNPRLAYLYHTARGNVKESGDRVVVLAGVLPDDINIDYGGFRDQIVSHINGQPVRNLHDVFAVLDRDGQVASVRLQGIGVDLALDPTLLPEANARLAERYRIPSLRRPPETTGE